MKLRGSLLALNHSDELHMVERFRASPDGTE
jgi:hypothetical protein